MRPGIRWLGGLAVVAAGTAVLAVSWPSAPAPPGPEPGRALFQLHCATCHGADGRGATWRARLLWLEPGDLAGAEARQLSEQYLADIVRHGGPNFGKPGMPSFGFILSSEEIRSVVEYLRALGVAAVATPTPR